ncbi:hypothetical protein KI387_041379, partial [Taxus chinensis]
IGDGRYGIFQDKNVKGRWEEILRNGYDDVPARGLTKIKDVTGFSKREEVNVAERRTRT